ncbi:hypothetical protein AVEN_10094-1 [Araneus ventricosus]|uniref:Uncharacterized protein n=1 Tax=Araneus ventricosus TaxID=182803 RepID=A0A4Y2Q924_ARAVE|nr:hypothetical protein AVEN_10094-1 [Araneus ventricosus]
MYLSFALGLLTKRNPKDPKIVGELYRVPTKDPYHPFNYPMAAAIFIRVVSRHGTVTMWYWMKPLTAPPGGKRWTPADFSRNVSRLRAKSSRTLTYSRQYSRIFFFHLLTIPMTNDFRRAPRNFSSKGFTCFNPTLDVMGQSVLKIQI